MRADDIDWCTNTDTPHQCRTDSFGGLSHGSKFREDVRRRHEPRESSRASRPRLGPGRPALRRMMACKLYAVFIITSAAAAPAELEYAPPPPTASPVDVGSGDSPPAPPARIQLCNPDTIEYNHLLAACYLTPSMVSDLSGRFGNSRRRERSWQIACASMITLVVVLLAVLGVFWRWKLHQTRFVVGNRTHSSTHCGS